MCLPNSFYGMLVSRQWISSVTRVCTYFLQLLGKRTQGRFLQWTPDDKWLADVHIDLLHEGIPYLTPVQEEAMRCALNSKHQEFAKFSSPAFLSPDGADMGPAKGPIQIPDEQKDFIADIWSVLLFLLTFRRNATFLKQCYLHTLLLPWSLF